MGMNIQYLTFSELKSLLSVIQNPKHRLMIKVAFWHGLRATETVTLLGREIQSGYINKDRLKDSETCNQPFVKHPDPLLDEAAELTEIADRMKREKRLDQPIFGDIGRGAFLMLMRRAGEKANLPAHKRHPHVLKHTCGMVAAKNGIKHAQKRLGHVSISSTGHYMGLSEERANREFLRIAQDATALEAALEE